ncbi:MAG: hemolysin III family protein [Pseudomonadota bacterium]
MGSSSKTLNPANPVDPGALLFPRYSTGEQIVDGMVHLIGVLASWIGALVLLWLGGMEGSPFLLASLAVYSVGLVMTFSFSAAYHLIHRPRPKEWLRRLDHAAIYIMIAGTYTPFALMVIGGPWGLGLLVAVWVVAVLGCAQKIFMPRRFENTAVALCLAQGWAVLLVLEPLLASVSTPVLILLALGGGLYTLGVVFHLSYRRPYHTVAWHMLVLAAATCHYAAVVKALL